MDKPMLEPPEAGLLPGKSCEIPDIFCDFYQQAMFRRVKPSGDKNLARAILSMASCLSSP